jgi:glycosyltransferase involved in cell wall biosynthesis
MLWPIFKRMKIRENSSERNHVRVVNIVTSSLSVRFLEGQSEYFGKKGYEVLVVSSPGEELRKAQRDGVQTVAVSMAREISPWKDLVSLWRLMGAISRLRPSITNVATPKAGLLGGIAAWVCRVPCRYYTLLGLRCETTTRLKRKLLLLTERIACLCAHRVICVSESLQQKAIDLGIVDASRTVVLAAGSYAGVDPKRFAATSEALGRADRIRQDLGIPREARVVGFVGRLTKDKGTSELVEAYLDLRREIPELRLLLVGEMEAGDPLPPQIRSLIANDPGIVHTGFLRDPADYYHVMDVLAFPTHREGFGTVALEAHTASKPVIAARATGVVDAVIDGVTGILVPVGDAQALANALALVIGNRSLAAALGSAGRERVLREFRQEIVWDAIADEYLQLLQAKQLAVPTLAARKETTTALTAGAFVSR